jgi:hypothetical protein
MGDPKGTKTVPDGVGINVYNVIRVEMEDLSERDENDLELEVQWEMEEVMAKRKRQKLACFQMTRSGVVKKGDTMKASTPVNSPFTLEELVHIIDVSVSSKYVVNLEPITWTLTNSVRGSVESLRLEFKQESEKLPRQVRAIVQQGLGEAGGKREFESPGASSAVPNLSATTTQGMPVNIDRLGSRGTIANPNL